MFGNAFFGPAYFAGAYFGHAGAGDVVEPPAPAPAQHGGGNAKRRFEGKPVKLPLWQRRRFDKHGNLVEPPAQSIAPAVSSPPMLAPVQPEQPFTGPTPIGAAIIAKDYRAAPTLAAEPVVIDHTEEDDELITLMALAA